MWAVSIPAMQYGLRPSAGSICFCKNMREGRPDTNFFPTPLREIQTHTAAAACMSSLSPSLSTLSVVSHTHRSAPLMAPLP